MSELSDICDEISETRSLLDSLLSRRNRKITEWYATGEITLKSIGYEAGLTSERVRDIISRQLLEDRARKEELHALETFAPHDPKLAEELEKYKLAIEAEQNGD